MQREFDKGSAIGFGWQSILLALAFAGAMVLNPTQAANLTVTNTNDSGAGSLRQTIADATDGDTITFDSTLAGSTITLTSGELVLDKDLSIDGDLNGDGVPDVTVSGNDSTGVFGVRPDTVANLEGLVITAGRAIAGGGIGNGGTLTLTDSTVSGNTARRGPCPGPIWIIPCTGGEGGGIYNSYSSTLTLFNSIVSGNNADRGGGIYNLDGTLTLTDSTVSSNSDIGIENDGTVTLINSTVSDNDDGGIANGYGGTVTLINSTVSNNDDGGIGNSGTVTLINSTVSNNDDGGIGNSGTVTLTNSTVSSNSASRVGGGIANGYGGTVTLTNSTVSNNGAGRRGGGIYNENGGTVALTNCTVSNNGAGSRGGGIFNRRGSLIRIANTIVANSETNGVEGGDCDGGGTLDTANSANNLIETGCVEIATLTDNPQLGPLQDNGGPTETHALLPGSPAIDFIPRADCEVTEDQRGVARPQGLRCDIGAFEREAIPIPPGPPAPVPAAGKWALGVLGVLLLSAMVALDRRQRRHPKGDPGHKNPAS